MSYEYLNARLRAMRGALLPESTLEALVKTRRFQDFCDALAALPGYGEALASSQTRFQGLEAVEWALKEDLSATARKIRMMAALSGDGKGASSPFFWDKERRYLPKDERESETLANLVEVLIQKWDLFNVKTLLRGKHSHTDPQELNMSLIPVGKLEHGSLQTLVAARDVKEVFDYLITWQVDFAKPLREGLRSYVERKDLVMAEYYLDRYYFEKGLHLALGERAENGSLREILETQVDLANILTALRELRVKTDAHPATFFIAGGRLSFEFLRSLLTEKKLEGVLEKLAVTPYSESLQGTLLFIEKGDLSVVEKKLDEMLMKKALRMYLRDPLGLGVLIGYLWMKVAEVTNLKMIAHGVFYKMPEHTIREKLMGAAA